MKSHTGGKASINRSLTTTSLLVFAIVIAYSLGARAQDKQAETQAKAKIELTTEPSPAQKGSNTVRVKLTDAQGNPISGAEVSVTFFMPAMPSMGMAEMKTVVKGVEKGPGTYEGKGDLGSGGIWQVTVTAQENGKTIATSKLNVKATGGM